MIPFTLISLAWVIMAWRRATKSFHMIMLLLPVSSSNVIKIAPDADPGRWRPVIMPAIKSQQYRWNKGAAETAVKNLGKVLMSGLPIKTKLHATFHLLNSSIFVLLLIGGIISLPVLYIKYLHPEIDFYFHLASILLIGFMYVMGWAFQNDLEEMKKTHPAYRKHLKDKYGY